MPDHTDQFCFFLLGSTALPTRGALGTRILRGGQCKDGQSIGDRGCTWRVVGMQKTVNASCMYKRIDTTVEQATDVGVDVRKHNYSSHVKLYMPMAILYPQSASFARGFCVSDA